MLLSMVNPFLTKVMIDRAIGDKDLSLFLKLAFIGGGVFILETLIGNAKHFFEKFIRLRVGFDLNKKVYRKLQAFSLAWFRDRSTGEHLYRINYDLERVTELITTVPPQALAIFPQLFLTLAIVFWLNWQLAVFSLCLAPFLYLPSFYLARKMRSVWSVLIASSEKIFKNLEEVFSHMLLIKVFGKEGASARKHLKMLAENIRLNVQNVRLEIFASVISQVLSKVIAGAIAFYGIYQVIRGKLTFGTFTAVMVYLNKLMGLQWQFAQFFQTTVVGLVSCERVSKILDASDGAFQLVEAKTKAFHRPEIVFQGVNFSYRSGEQILKNLDLKIECGRHLALVGPSGCGKTTFLNLILKLYEPSSGSITIGGYPLRDLTTSSLTRQIGMALQEPFLWNDSIRNNIRYGKEDATEQEISRVAKWVGIDAIVKHLPSGYETVIGENACKLSEGQKQRIAIARALIKDPKILILDEAMSSMDSASEERILTCLGELRNGMTLITVSHRLSSVVRADVVCYIKSPGTMIVDTPGNLLRSDRDFISLFAGQGDLMKGFGISSS